LIKNVNYTNIIIVNVPYRYDVKDYPYVNSMIKAFNSKLLKLPNRFNYVSTVTIVNNRLLSTKHGLHLNVTGKELLSNQLALHILSTLEANPVIPYHLGGTTRILELILKTVCLVILTNTNSNHNRKTPITRSKDFLWHI